jgi:hypothetical protein
MFFEAYQKYPQELKSCLIQLIHVIYISYQMISTSFNEETEFLNESRINSLKRKRISVCWDPVLSLKLQ